MINVPLLMKTLEHIEAHPDEWFQRRWATEIVQEPITGEKRPKDYLFGHDWGIEQGQTCGTAYCFAGWAMLLSRPDLEVDFSVNSTIGAYTTTSKEQISDVARAELGLSETQAGALFSAGNSLDTIKNTIDLIIKGDLL